MPCSSASDWSPLSTEDTQFTVTADNVATHLIHDNSPAERSLG